MFASVALRKESVDRNLFHDYIVRLCRRSLSARRAWIEIMALDQYLKEQEVSLSARRAWIEISVAWLDYSEELVALRKESVDRNTERRH